MTDESDHVRPDQQEALVSDSSVGIYCCACCSWPIVAGV